MSGSDYSLIYYVLSVVPFFILCIFLGYATAGARKTAKAFLLLVLFLIPLSFVLLDFIGTFKSDTFIKPFGAYFVCMGAILVSWLLTKSASSQNTQQDSSDASNL